MARHLRLGLILLAIWLIAAGAVEILGIGHRVILLALDVLAIVTGVVILAELGSIGTVERLGMVFLSAWLILIGLMPFIGMGIPYGSTIAIVLALVAGILLLVGLKGKRTAAKLGMVLLAVWLIATAVLSITGLLIPASGIILAVLGIVAGILILIWR
jgi:hypothetical protein